MKTSEVFRKAGDVLRERGWCQGGLMNAEGKVCALGALGVAECRGALSGPSQEIYRNLSQQILDGRLIGADWNDSPGRTVEEVYAVLDAGYVLALQEEGIEPEDVL